MQEFTTLDGLVAPIDQANVDTDAIIPKQFLTSIKRSGFGVNLFDEWRYLDHGVPGMDNSARPLNPEFILNQPRYQGCEILLARRTFGCGSSREHAPWALFEFGISCIIAPSFADIFYSNCFKNGLLPIRLSEQEVDALFQQVVANPGYRLKIDLAAQTITRADAVVMKFEVDPFRKDCLLNGLDEIGLSLQQRYRIQEYETRRARQAPWLFPEKGQ